jgi:uncharacterized membrane protein YkoI
MKHRTLLFTAISLSLACASAVATAEDRVMSIGEMVAHMQSTFGGEVAAIQLDSGGDKRPHYHVDMRFPGGLAHMDVDAATREIVARDPVAAPASGSVTLLEAATIAGATLPGHVLAAEYDPTDGAAHYDVDVRLPTERIARLKIDAVTREVGWRQPAIAPR